MQNEIVKLLKKEGKLSEKTIDETVDLFYQKVKEMVQ